ncbi:MAG: OmpA family protein [Proteobacteria bacterium]|nr:OmpA family protein [Pseudomonadota bacterium]
MSAGNDNSVGGASGVAGIDTSGGASARAFSRRRYGRRMGDVNSQQSGPPIWLITFTDTIALMLTFFVMLFAMSTPADKEWSEITAALFGQLNKFYGPSFNRGPVDALNLQRVDFDRALDISYLSALMESVVEDNENLSGARFIEQPGMLIISLPQDLLFEPGNADISEKGARALYGLGGALSRIKNKVEVWGHADPRPFQGQERTYESNWELSLARAANVAGVLNDVGYEKTINIIGNSSGRYQDLSAITDEDMRMDLARRVDIVIYNHDGRKKEPLFDLPPL